MKKGVIITSIIVLLGLGYFLTQQTQMPLGSGGIENSPEFNKELSYTKHFKEWAKHDASNIEYEVKARLEDEKIIKDYALKNNIVVTDEEVNVRFKELYSKNGGEEKYLAQIKEQHGIEKSDYLEKLRIELLRAKVALAVKKPLVEWLLEQKK